MLKTKGSMWMRFVNNRFNFLLFLMALCVALGDVLAAGDPIDLELQRRKMLDFLLERSRLVVLGHFDLKDLNLDELKPNEPVESLFVIDKKIKWDDSEIESFIVPVPYKLFSLRKKSRCDKFNEVVNNHVDERFLKERENSKGAISDLQLRAYVEMWRARFDAMREEIDFCQTVSRGPEDSFDSSVQYVMFLSLPIDSERMDWGYTMSYGFSALGRGGFVDLLFKEEE